MLNTLNTQNFTKNSNIFENYLNKINIAHNILKTAQFWSKFI